MIVTALNRPPPPQEENLDAAQGWTHSADGRCNPGDSRFAEHASGGRYTFSPSPSDEEEVDATLEERNETPEVDDPFAETLR